MHWHSPNRWLAVTSPPHPSVCRCTLNKVEHLVYAFVQLSATAIVAQACESALRFRREEQGHAPKTSVTLGQCPVGVTRAIVWNRQGFFRQPPADTNTMAQLVELDSRRRASLGRIGNPDHTRYLVEEAPDGSLLFTPAVVMTAHEEALLRNPDLVARIESDLADPSRLVESRSRRPRPR